MTKCAQVDFASDAAMQELAQRVDALLTKIRKKHKGIRHQGKPFVVVKADNADPALATTPWCAMPKICWPSAAMGRLCHLKRSATF